MSLLLATPLLAATPRRQWADRHLASSSEAQSLPMALANGGTVQREHTCLVDSTSSCPGLIEINRRTWRLDLPPSANLFLYGPSFMSEIVSSIVTPNAEELTPNITSAVSYVQEQRLGQAASASWSDCNVPGGGDATCRLRGACRDGVCTYTFRNGARLTAVTNAEELQDPGSQASRDAFVELLRANSFSHVFFMMPHGQEYWVESAAAGHSRRNDPAQINDSLGRNMCLPSVAGTVATWDEYSACVSESVYWQAAHRLLRSDRLTLVVPWMQAVPSDSRLSGHAVLSTAKTAIGRGCGICDPATSRGCPTPNPIFGHLLHQCIVVCERGSALNASLAARRPGGPCLAGTVPVMAEQLLAAAYPEMARDPSPDPTRASRIDPLAAEPIWAGTAASRYALFWREVELPSNVLEAHILATAAQSGPSEKLLGAYRLYVGGAAIGIGPGRGGARTAAYPDGGDANHTYLDEYNVTALVRAAPASGTLVLGLQCYHETGDTSSGVLLELRMHLSNGSTSSVGTSSSDGRWLTYDATAAFNPTQSTSSQYDAPQEWSRSGLMPVGWMEAGFKPSAAWRPPASRRDTARSLAASVLWPKPTQPLSLTTGVRPSSLRQLNETAFFADFGHEMMGGLTLRLPIDAFPVGTALQVTLGEELVGDRHTSTSIMYPMRTGNRYRNVWTVTITPPSDVTTFEHHEYMLFRFATVEVVSPRPLPARSGALELDLAAWRVNYPWRDGDSHFSSSDSTLNAVWQLAADTLRFTSLDTATDSNTRERLPYEADGYITGQSRLALQAEFAWPRHSWRHNILNPTWPTEWRQTTPLMALADFMATGEMQLFASFKGALAVQTQQACVNATTHLVDFRQCARQTAGLGSNSPNELRDLVDWPQASRDDYVLTDAANTVVNAYAVGGLRALASLSNASGDGEGAAALAVTADSIESAVNELLWDPASGLYRDGLDNSGEPTQHAAWHASVFAAAFGLVPAARWPRLLSFFRQRGMVGSVYAAYYFLQAYANPSLKQPCPPLCPTLTWASGAWQTLPVAGRQRAARARDAYVVRE
jgi:hypothetical protein